VKLHRNAKTTPVTRALIVDRIRQAHWPPAEAAAAAGISVRTAYKWLRRHRLGGRRSPHYRRSCYLELTKSEWTSGYSCSRLSRP
jgi:transposase